MLGSQASRIESIGDPAGFIYYLNTLGFQVFRIRGQLAFQASRIRDLLGSEASRIESIGDPAGFIYYLNFPGLPGVEAS